MTPTIPAEEGSLLAISPRGCEFCLDFKQVDQFKYRASNRGIDYALPLILPLATLAVFCAVASVTSNYASMSLIAFLCIVLIVTLNAYAIRLFWVYQAIEVDIARGALTREIHSVFGRRIMAMELNNAKLFRCMIRTSARGQYDRQGLVLLFDGSFEPFLVASSKRAETIKSCFQGVPPELRSGMTETVLPVTIVRLPS